MERVEYKLQSSLPTLRSSLVPQNQKETDYKLPCTALKILWMMMMFKRVVSVINCHLESTHPLYWRFFNLRLPF